MPLSRRALVLALVPLLAAQAPMPRRPSGPGSAGNAPPPAAAGPDVLRHRGFTVNLAPVASLPNRAAIEAAVRRQVDITADCGVKPEILAFFREQRMAFVPGTGKGGGLYAPRVGIEIDTVPLPPPNNPVLLHELIHALHHGYMPQGNANPDIERFYNIAKKNDFYPDAKYMMSNKNEYFAVSGSLYLWGVVARAPHTREALRKQPRYYEWLGELFGVKK